jgi:hypothetical protein
MMKRARGGFTSVAVVVTSLFGAIGFPVATTAAQVGVIPSITYHVRRSSDTERFQLVSADVAGTDDRRVLTDFAQGTSITGSFGQAAQADVATQAIRIGVYGKAACADTTCVKHLWFSATVNAHIVDAFGESATAIKQYVLSDKGAPLTLSLPSNVPILTFSTATPSAGVTESYAAGQLTGSARLIPVRLGGGSLVNNGSLSIGYSLEVHGAFTVNGVDGSAFALLTPSYSYLLGDSLQSAISATPQPRSSVAGLSYRVGYQFGTGTAISATGSYAFTSLRDGRRQLSLAFNQALGAIGAAR